MEDEEIEKGEELAVMRVCPYERAYFYNTHRFDLGGKWNVAKPLGGSTRWGHMTGGLTNHLSDLNPYINSCGLGLVVFGLLSV